MSIDKLNSETESEEQLRKVDSSYSSMNINEKSTLTNKQNEITDICSNLYDEINNFIELHNSIGKSEPDKDDICNASYAFNKIAYMLNECVKLLSNNIDTSWYH